MDEIKNTLEKALVKNSDGTTLISVGTVVVGLLGAGVLYYMIPERKRKNLFK